MANDIEKGTPAGRRRNVAFTRVDERLSNGRSNDGARVGAKRKGKHETVIGAKKLWRCSKCRQTFVTANLWHSCVNIPIDVHFEDAPLHLREAFDAFVNAARRNGRVVLRPVKTRIALQAYTRFAAVTVRLKDLACHVILDHGARSPPTLRVEKIGGVYLHAFILATAKDVDARVTELLAQAYAADQARHGQRFK
jgi:hypothetical protein